MSGELERGSRRPRSDGGVPPADPVGWGGLQPSDLSDPPDYRTGEYPRRAEARRGATMIKRCLGGLLLAAALSGTAFAESKCPDAEATTGSGKNWEVVRGPDGRKIIRIKTLFCIEGKVPKPSVIYVLNASTINYEWDTLKQDFLPRIVRSVEQQPF